jgi:hypothetical protein
MIQYIKEFSAKVKIKPFRTAQSLSEHVVEGKIGRHSHSILSQIPQD